MPEGQVTLEEAPLLHGLRIFQFPEEVGCKNAGAWDGKEGSNEWKCILSILMHSFHSFFAVDEIRSEKNILD
jgi:hypothetical protein